MSDYVWGVDPSTRRVAFGFDGPQPGSVAVDVPKGLFYGARLAEIYRQARNLAALWARRCPPLIVFVEQPAAAGRQPAPQLYYAVGVIQAAVYEALRFAQPYPTEVRPIMVSTWRAAVLRGNATKVELLEWACSQGYEPLPCPAKRCRGAGCGRCEGTGADLDCSDAWVIARAGRRLVEGGLRP